MYSQRIDRLKEHLQSLQLISLKREELERQVRTQLQEEIRELRGREGGKEEGRGEEEGAATNWETEVTLLQADLAKVDIHPPKKKIYFFDLCFFRWVQWEQKCTELAVEKELAVEVALVQKEVFTQYDVLMCDYRILPAGQRYISQLRTVLAAKEEEVRDLTEKTQRCSCQFSDRQPTHSSPLHKTHSSPSHASPSHHPSPPHHQLNTSPTSQLSPSHQKTASPTPAQVSHTHKPHHLHSSSPKKTPGEKIKGLYLLQN